MLFLFIGWLYNKGKLFGISSSGSSDVLIFSGVIMKFPNEVPGVEVSFGNMLFQFVKVGKIALFSV